LIWRRNIVVGGIISVKVLGDGAEHIHLLDAELNMRARDAKLRWRRPKVQPLVA
jgi:hypothetical protein